MYSAIDRQFRLCVAGLLLHHAANLMLAAGLALCMILTLRRLSISANFVISCGVGVEYRRLKKLQFYVFFCCLGVFCCCSFINPTQ